MSETQVSIIPDYTLKIGHIPKLVANGHELAMTPHLGNLGRAELGLASLGVQLDIIEVNRAGRDPIYRPEHINVRNQQYRIGQVQGEQLSPYIRMDQDQIAAYNGDLAGVRLAPSPAATHYAAARKALGEQVGLFIEHLLTDERLVKMLSILTELDRSCFSRYVDSNGLVSKIHNPHVSAQQTIESFMSFKKALIEMIILGVSKDDASGRIHSNTVGILLTMIKALLKEYDLGHFTNTKGPVDIYTVSGLTMIHYTKSQSFQQEFNRLYQEIQRHFDFLPTQINFRMIPGAILDFLPYHGEEKLETLVISIGENHRQQAEINRQIAANTQNATVQSAAIKRKDAQYRFLRNELKPALQQARQTNRLSQHDTNGHRIYVPEQIQDMTFQQVQQLITA